MRDIERMGEMIMWCCQGARESQGERHDLDCPLRSDEQDLEESFSDFDFGDK